jgi:hypothetical protein
MGRPVDLVQWRRDRLAAGLARRLKAAPLGFVRVEVDGDGHADGVAVAEWRAAGRQAGRVLGWSVRTLASQGFVILYDNRRRGDLTVAEQNLRDLRDKAAMDRFAYVQRPRSDG